MIVKIETDDGFKMYDIHDVRWYSWDSRLIPDETITLLEGRDDGNPRGPICLELTMKDRSHERVIALGRIFFLADNGKTIDKL